MAIVVYSVCVAVLYSLEIACRLRKLYVILKNLVSLSNLRLLTLISIVGQLKADIANVHIAGVFMAMHVWKPIRSLQLMSHSHSKMSAHVHLLVASRHS